MGQNLVCIYTLMTIAKRAEQQTLSVRLYQTLQHPPKKIESDRTTRFYPKKMVDLLFYLYILVAVFQNSYSHFVQVEVYLAEICRTHEVTHKMSRCILE